MLDWFSRESSLTLVDILFNNKFKPSCFISAIIFTAHLGYHCVTAGEEPLQGLTWVSFSLPLLNQGQNRQDGGPITILSSPILRRIINLTV